MLQTLSTFACGACATSHRSLTWIGPWGHGASIGHMTTAVSTPSGGEERLQARTATGDQLREGDPGHSTSVSAVV